MAGRVGGFTLIEVMVAILVLGFGLLGFALLQTMSVRFTQSANYRTQATNLSYELLDQIRSDRAHVTNYVGAVTSSTEDGNCEPKTGNSVAAADYLKDWSCRMGKALGAGATANVTMVGDKVTVDVSWGDERWKADAENTKFSVGTSL